MNNFDEFIIQFIMQQRNTMPESDGENENQALYLKFEEILGAVLFKDAPEIKLILTRSYQKYSLLFSAKQEDKTKYYFLFDKYLAEQLRLLNAIFLYQDYTEPDLWKLSYQLFSEETHLLNENILALYTAMNANALGEYQCKELLNINENSKWVDIQLDYIMAHEVGHWLYGLEQYQDERSGAVQEIDQLLTEVYEQYSRMFVDQDYIELITESVDKIRGNENMIEECFCDAVAFSYIFAKLEKEQLLEKKLEILKALMLCLLHMQLLSMCNFTVNDEGNYEIANSIRLSFFRNYVTCFFSEEEMQIFAELLNSTVIEYENKITDKILPIFNTIETRIDNLYDCIESDDCNVIIGSILAGNTGK